MKRFTVVTAMFGVSLLAVWIIFQAFAAGNNGHASLKVRSDHNAILKTLNSGKQIALPVPAVDTRNIAPLFDSNGRVVSDPSGALSNAGASGAQVVPVTGAEMNVAPVYDASGAVVSNPSGLQLNAPNSNDRGNIAPVFDSNGRVVSDPSGTILNRSNP